MRCETGFFYPSHAELVSAPHRTFTPCISASAFPLYITASPNQPPIISRYSFQHTGFCINCSYFSEPSVAASFGLSVPIAIGIRTPILIQRIVYIVFRYAGQQRIGSLILGQCYP